MGNEGRATAKCDLVAQALDKMDVRSAISSTAPAIIRRFRQTVKSACPQIRDDQLDVYADNLSRRVHVLEEMILAKHLSALSAALSERELDVLCDFTRHPGIKTLLDILERHSASMSAVVQKVMREEGVVAHRQALRSGMNTP